MRTPSDVAKLVHVDPQTIRNYTERYGHLLSPHANRRPRLFTDEDVDVLCAIAELRKAGVPLDEIEQHLQKDAPPPIIDATPQTPPKEPLTPSNEFLSLAPHEWAELRRLPEVRTRIEAIEQKMQNHMVELRVELRRRHTADRVWYIGMGVWIGMVTTGTIFFLMWLLVNGAPW